MPCQRLPRSSIPCLVFLLCLGLTATSPPAATSGPPGIGHDYSVVVEWSDPPGGAKLLVRPGGGEPPARARCLGGTECDATLRVRILEDGAVPLADCPAEQLWLEWPTPGPAACAGRFHPDGPTDAEGWTSWSLPLSAGGWSSPAEGGVRFIVGGMPSVSPPLPLYANGPDLDASGRVDLSDVVLFAGDRQGPYAFRSDFDWDGAVNLVDLVVLAQASGAACP